MLNRIKEKIITLFAVICTTLIYGCADNNAKHTLRNIPQNIWHYISPALINSNLMSIDDQQKQLTNYLSHYFSPWTDQNRIDTDQQIQQSEITFIQNFTQNPGWGENYQPYNRWWIKNIVDSMDMPHFPNHKSKAVVINSTDIRVLPTIEPSYNNWTEAGEGYPFDNLQLTSVVMGTPVLLLQKTTNGVWSLILIHNVFGWVKTDALANVDDNFIKKYQTKNYVAFTKDYSHIVDEQHHINSLANLGAIFPLMKQANDNFEILMLI
jgi:hypothetical protein